MSEHISHLPCFSEALAIEENLDKYGSFVSPVASWSCEAGQIDRSQAQKLVRETLLSASTSSVVTVSADASLTQKQTWTFLADDSLPLNTMVRRNLWPSVKLGSL